MMHVDTSGGVVGLLGLDASVNDLAVNYGLVGAAACCGPPLIICDLH